MTDDEDARSAAAIVEGDAIRAMALMARVLGYAQARSLIGHLLGGPPSDPETLVALNIRKLEIHQRLVEDSISDSLAEALIDRLRADTATTIVMRARTGHQMASPWRSAPHALHFGSAEWFEEVIDAGARAAPLRFDFDDIVFASTRRLVDLANARRDEVRRRHADTQPIVRR